MKSQNRISQLTLELYYRGLATNKERKLVEKALISDSEVRKRYDALQESDQVIRQLVTQELNRLNIPEMPPAPSPRKKKLVVGLLLVAAVLCALIPAYFYHKSNDSNKDNAITEETEFIEDIPNNEIATTEEPPVIAEPSEPPVKTEIVEKPRAEQPVRRDNGKSNEKTENPRTEPVRTKEPELAIEPASGVSIATVPTPDTGIQLRGGNQSQNKPVTPAVPEETSNISIPPGITTIFENMFADRGLTFVIIPSRITTIGKNAFSGNPLLSVTIGANVSIENNAIPGNFAAVYNGGGKVAGTYTRPDVNSEVWQEK